MNPEHTTPAIGIDLGGTYTRAALVDRDGSIRAQIRERTVSSPSADVLFGQIAQLRTNLCATDAAMPIGVAIPGILDDARTAVVRSVNFPVLEGRPVAKQLAGSLGGPVTLVTDADAATWGESQARDKPARRFIHLRLGTGIACGVVIDGQLLRLDAGRTAHLDVLVVDRTPTASPCPCGLNGCLETIVSGAALQRQAESIGITDGLPGLRSAIQEGRPEAVEILNRAARALGTALENLNQTYEADLICLGGGVADHLPELIDEARSQLQACEPPAKAIIHPATLGDNAGVIGAALLAITCQ